MSSQNTILDVQNVSKRFGARELFANLSFSIAEGQKVGLIARNGTGKSTLLSILTGRELLFIAMESARGIWSRNLPIMPMTPCWMPASTIRAMMRR